MSDHPTPDGHLTPEYLRYMKSAEWAEFRVRYYRSHPKVCVGCASATEIDLHHRTYERFTHERLTDVVALCRPCHNKVHALHGEGGISLHNATMAFIPKRRRDRKPRPRSPMPRKTTFSPVAKIVIRNRRRGRIEAAKARVAKLDELRLLIRSHVAKRALDLSDGRRSL